MDLQFASFFFFFFFFFFVAHKDEPSYFFLRVFSAGLTVTPPSVVLGPANALTFSLRGPWFLLTFVARFQETNNQFFSNTDVSNFSSHI